MAAFPHRTVLLVEDDDDVLDAIVDALEDHGHAVTVAMHGAQALQRLQERRPDVILLDLMMPVMDGPTFLGALRDRPDLADIPVIVVSAGAATDVGPGVRYVRKPFAIDELLAAIEAAVQGGVAGAVGR